MLKVFLVEDETVIREGLRDRIPWEQYGYRFVGEAADGEVALPLIRKTRPDVLITDIKMPFMDGLSLFSAFSAIYPVSLERQLLWGFSQMRCGGNGRLYTAGDCTDPDELRVTKRQCRLVCCCGNACGTAVDAERVL